MAENPRRSLQDLVGNNTYAVWVDMLHDLAPDTTTYHLSVLLAGMLQYALDQAMKRGPLIEGKDSVAISLISADDEGYPEAIKEQIHDLLERLFEDAGVEAEKTSFHGEHYSLTDEVCVEFANWFDNPWD